MENSVKGVAKRLLFSLSVLSVLGGCAVYDAGYSPAYYSQPVYSATPIYGAVPYYAPPVYVAPPVFQFDYRSSGGHRWHDHSHRGREGGRHHWRDEGGHRWRHGGSEHHNRAHPGMRGDGRWRAPGEGSGRR